MKKFVRFVNYTRPESKDDVLRLLGMVNFIAKFAPRISDVTAPLRELIKKNVEFHWLQHHEKAFNDLKLKLMEPGVLRYYDVTKHVTLQADASQKGTQSCTKTKALSRTHLRR